MKIRKQSHEAPWVFAIRFADFLHLPVSSLSGMLPRCKWGGRGGEGVENLLWGLFLDDDDTKALPTSFHESQRRSMFVMLSTEKPQRS